MHLSNFLQFLPLGFWALSTATGIMIVLISLFLILYYRQRLKAVGIDSGDVAELAGQKQQIENDIESLRSWMGDQKEELQHLDAERNEQEIVRAELQRLEQECATKEENNRLLRNEVGDLENQKYLLAQAIEKLEQDKDKHLHEAQELGEYRKGIENDLRKIEVELLEKKKEAAKLNNDVESHRQMIAELEKTMREKKNAVEDIEYRHNSLLKKVEGLQDKAQQFVLIKSKLVEIKQEIEDTRAELSNKKRMLDDAEREIHGSRIESEELEKKKINIETKIEALEDTLVKQQNKCEQMAQKLEYTKGQLLDFKQELENTKQELSIKQGLRDEVVRTVQEYRLVVDKLKSEEIALNASIKTLEKKFNKQFNNADGDGEVTEEKYRDLWQPVTFPTLKPSPGEVDEQQLLRCTADYIKGQKLHFPERVLYAFHTALKVNDISPLVVLAGISGTGKSELPRRYAEGMGIHHVILAVQPRWDSPQDLFGFYNYLEKRYKATELARAMVQFELYNRDLWPLPKEWGHSRSDRMLLVLLDEMNLARVEYYFSEFLSRLETRRGINPDNKEERTKAEIALEMGSLHEGEKPIRLFPGENILFTGTMNEDETTQALSDKVLDRACVMRFGRPKRIIDQDDRPRSTPAKNGLTFEQWKSFLKPTLHPSEAERVRRWTNELNDAMEGINRPFGHRVAQAIKAYIANYPHWVKDRIQRAMADQIEQRIMPKLRGVEIAETDYPLRKIQSVIEECNDQLLLKVFKQGADPQQQVFIWRGIDREEE
ncbi:MAG: AAA family ATPase [bacterium]